jgi:alkanesulfonate monooxygenase SsuD/methylene tetrahydromethanopterin reductase-like flavin-dependent oxidoreductase (luciferase family)
MALDEPAAVTFGLYLPQVNRGYRELRALAQAAERCAFSAVWFIDHLALPGTAPVLEGWTLATAVAAATSRIRVGHLVLCDSFRHPVLLGRMAATLDHISDGRLNLGMGWGSSKADMCLLGRGDDPAPARAARLAESIGIVRAVMAGKPLAHHGEHFSVSGPALPPAAVQPHVPLYIGGASERTLSLVRDHADWWNCPATERHRLAWLAPRAGKARISANYSMAFASRPRVMPASGGQAYQLIGPAEHIAQALCEDRRVGVEQFIIQLIDPAATAADLEHFMARVAPVVRGASSKGRAVGRGASHDD